ncbi:MAG: hypothetical protein CEE43_19175 [Promethearchaeota archaeon Loki_b32]|nr:MAG: hypothetical protein CEE43_19175 [Candidatus Lokiarchaeota archaeon Loki_b32]
MVWNDQNAIESEINELTVQNIWHRYYDGTFDLDGAYLPIPNMSISIDLTTEASILLSFTCTALINGNLGRSDVTIYYYIDGLIISNPNARAGGYTGNYSSYFHSVSLNYFSEGWSVGTHNISMLVSSTVDTNDIQYCHLIIQSFSG